MQDEGAGCGVGGSPAGCGIGRPGAEASTRPLPIPQPDEQVQGWRGWARALFGLDLRSLAAARIAFGVLLLLDLVARSLDLQAHYSDAGVLPREAVVGGSEDGGRWSLHFLSGSTWIQGLLFAIQGLVALAVVVGYRTRLAIVVSWLLLVSLHHRNGAVLQAGDILLRCLLFFAVFLPMGARWSVDSALHPQELRGAGRWLSVGGVGWILQLALVYVCTLLYKWHHAWGSGLAVGMALEIDIFATPLALWLRQFTGLTPWLTWITVTVEILGPLLILIPLRRGWNRTLAVVLMVGLHLGFSLFLAVGLFSWIAAAAWLALLPGTFWDGLDRLLRPRRGGRLTVAFDADCFFCRRAAALLRGLAGLPKAALIEAQRDPELAAAMERHHSWVVRDGAGALHVRYQAFLVLMAHSPVLRWFRPLAACKPVAALGDRCYRWIAANRDHVAWTVSWLRPAPPLPQRDRGYRLGQAVALIALVYVVLWNARGIDRDDRHYFKKDLGIEAELPLDWFDALDPIGRATGLAQVWDMFAPYPRLDDGWFVITGTTLGGEEIDLYNRGRFLDAEAGPIDWSKPELVSDTYVRQRWRKYLSRLARQGPRSLRWFSRWLTRHYNSQREGDERIRFFEVWFVEERTVYAGGTGEPERKRLQTHACFGGAALNEDDDE